MTSRATWVIGRGGLLGSAVVRASKGPSWQPAQPLAWGDPSRWSQSVVDAVRGFGTHVSTQQDQEWSIYWCAGAGVVGTSAAALAAETRAFSQFLELLGAEPSLKQARGAFCLASSAGGVYGGSAARPIVDITPVAPISDYGRAKLEQEERLLAWTRTHPQVATLVARLSNLFGPGQRLDKPQGLISQMSRAQIFGVPVHIFVSLDTIRDYLFADDAAWGLVSGLRRLHSESKPQHVVKIYASEREISIAGLIGVFRRMSRRQLRVISSLLPLRSQQPAVLQFRSAIWPDLKPPPTDLLEGINRVHEHQLRLFLQGRLPRPAGSPGAQGGPQTTKQPLLQR